MNSFLPEKSSFVEYTARSEFVDGLVFVCF